MPLRLHTLLVTLLLAATTLATGCETIVDVDLPDSEPQLVVNDLFVADSTWRVYVGQSLSIQGQEGRTAPPVENATVEILTDGRVVDTLVFGGGSSKELYRSPDGHGPLVGQEYTVRASAPAFEETAEATSHAPAPVPFSVEQAESGRFDIDVTITDPEKRVNHYALFVYERFTARGTSTTQTIAFTSASPLLRENTQAELGEGGRTTYGRALFSDATFQGQTRRVTIRLGGGATFAETRAAGAGGGKVFVALASLSEENYEYQRTAQLQDEVSRNPFAEAVLVHSNVRGGLGIFAGSSRAVRPSPLP